MVLRTGALPSHRQFRFLDRLPIPRFLGLGGLILLGSSGPYPLSASRRQGLRAPQPTYVITPARTAEEMFDLLG